MARVLTPGPSWTPKVIGNKDRCEESVVIRPVPSVLATSILRHLTGLCFKICPEQELVTSGPCDMAHWNRGSSRLTDRCRTCTGRGKWLNTDPGFAHSPPAPNSAE